MRSVFGRIYILEKLDTLVKYELGVLFSMPYQGIDFGFYNFI